MKFRAALEVKLSVPAGRMVHGLALIILAPRFLYAVAFPLAPQHFQISVHETLFVYPAVYRASTRHPQTAQRARDFVRATMWL